MGVSFGTPPLHGDFSFGSSLKPQKMAIRLKPNRPTCGTCLKPSTLASACEARARRAQGGLGVTSEALRAGLPVITSGILPFGVASRKPKAERSGSFSGHGLGP